MATPKTFDQLYTIFKNAMQTSKPDLVDFRDGSINDTLAGLAALAGNEIEGLVIDEFAKTFFATAHGPAVTGGPDDLQTLAVDHFGDRFARPGATKATGVVTFSRPTTGAGNVTIPIGTVVKTAPDASGQVQRYETEVQVVMTGLSINATVNAVDGGEGVKGNVDAGEVSVIESTLTDPTVVVTNAAAFSGGEEEQDDATYLQTIRNLIETIRGATKAAIEAVAKTVPGIETATLIEILMAVIEYDIATDDIAAGATFFRIPFTTLYVADANGTADAALVQNVKDAIFPVRAAGVFIEVKGATPLAVDWTAALIFNPGGPNFAELSSDPQKIIDTMVEYLNELPIGTGFSRAAADAAMLAIWGPAGTNDLTSSGFQTVSPTGDIAASAVTKLIAGAVGID